MLLYEDASLGGGLGLTGSRGVCPRLERGLYSEYVPTDFGDARCDGGADDSE